MKRNSVVLIPVLLVGAILAIWGLWPRSGGMSTAYEAQKDSLLRGDAVFWAEQQAYFRIRNGQWEKSTNLFDSPFTPVATAEASEMLTNHFKTGDIKNVEVKPDGNASPSSGYSNLIQEGDRLLVSGKNLFKIGNKTLAKEEFHKALLKAKEADSLGNTSITQANVDTINFWIAKCDSAIAADKISKNGKSGSSATKNGRPPVVNKDNSVGERPITKFEVKKKENDADKYWAKIKYRVYSYRKFKGTKEEAQKIMDAAPKLRNKAVLRPSNPENATILDAVYKAAIK